MEFSLLPLSFSELEGWEDDDPSSLFPVMVRCLDHMRGVKPYKTGSLGVTSDELADVFAAAASKSPKTPAEARTFFEEAFQPFQIVRSDGGHGFVTAFYEPEVDVSATPSEDFRFPFYRRPHDLIDIDDTNRPEGFDPSYAFARENKEGIGYYPRREAIDKGCLDGEGLEIAWARSKVDVFFAHVQGAARLVYPDGHIQRITYAAKAGHPFTGIGRYLVETVEIPLADVSMQSIRAWLAAHPDRADAVLWQNRSYIFFREAPVEGLDLGPVAAAKVPLEAMRSLAVDRLIHTFSSPFFIRSETLTHLTEGQPFARLMLALDTGTAIVGAARGDIFTGSGFDAGQLAGNVRNDADFTILIPEIRRAEVPLMVGRSRKTLSTDDRILWGKVARSTHPMPGRMEEIEAFEKSIEPPQEPEQKPIVKQAAPALRKAVTTKAFDDMAYQAPPQPKPTATRHQPLERPIKRKIAKERLKLEARIDLHGMFQDEAHDLLHGFIQRAFDRGLRHVLVITGKGSSMGSAGALKRAVPMWFGKPEFRHLISSWETAAQNHGGEGALYVRLARLRGGEE